MAFAPKKIIQKYDRPNNQQYSGLDDKHIIQYCCYELAPIVVMNWYPLLLHLSFILIIEVWQKTKRGCSLQTTIRMASLQTTMMLVFNHVFMVKIHDKSSNNGY